eukprot:883108-Rhodomonas_salina.1
MSVPCIAFRPRRSIAEPTRYRRRSRLRKSFLPGGITRELSATHRHKRVRNSRKTLPLNRSGVSFPVSSPIASG